MRSWLKQQVTEVTAWAGLYIILIGFVNLPTMVDVLIGVTLISIDDTKAVNFLRKITPWLHKKIDSPLD